MPQRFTGDRPVRAYGVLDVYLDPVDREVQHLSLAHTQVITKEYLNLGSDVGLFGLLNLNQGESVRTRRVDDFVNGAAQKLGDVHLELVVPSGMPEDRSLKLLDEDVILV